MVYTTKLSLAPFRKTGAGIDMVLVLALQEYDDHGTAPLPNVCVQISRLTSKVLNYVYLRSKRNSPTTTDLAMLGSMAVKHFHLTVERVCFHNSDIYTRIRLSVGGSFRVTGLLLPLLRQNVRPAETPSPKPEGVPAVISPTIRIDLLQFSHDSY